MKKLIMTMAVMTMAEMMMAAPAKVEVTAAGYPAWTGLTDKNYIKGRRVESYDLRQKVTVVVEFDAGQTHEQINQAGVLANLAGYRHASAESTSWMTYEIARDVIVVYCCRGTGKDGYKGVLDGLKCKEEEAGLRTFMESAAPMYADVSFPGAPDATNKRPFVYVMGVDGGEPLVAEQFVPKTTVAKVRDAIKKEKAKLTADNKNWKPFLGYIDEPKYFPNVEKDIAKGKPLTATIAALKKGIVAKDPEKAKEAQMLYDSLQQYKSDLAFRILEEHRACPHRAAYDLQRLVKYFPAEKKKLAMVAAKMKEKPEASSLANIYINFMKYSDPNFMCKNESEAKKIVAELNKYKLSLEKMKESKDVIIQNGALLLDSELDSLISMIPSKVPEK